MSSDCKRTDLQGVTIGFTNAGSNSEVFSDFSSNAMARLEFQRHQECLHLADSLRKTGHKTFLEVTALIDGFLKRGTKRIENVATPVDAFQKSGVKGPILDTVSHSAAAVIATGYGHFGYGQGGYGGTLNVNG